MIKTLKTFRYIIIFSIIYYCFSAWQIVGMNFFSSSAVPYYNQLLKSFLTGRLDIIPANASDLSFYQNRWYLYWGPSPVLLIGMFKMLTIESDRLYTLIIGIFNIIVFCYLLEEINKYFKLKLTNFSKYSLVIFFGLLTPNYYLSLSGRIWHTNQIVSIFYLLAGLLLLFMYLNKKRVIYFIAAVILFNLAWLARMTLAGYMIIIIYLLLIIKLTAYKRLFVIFMTITLLTVVLFFIYNFARFNNIFEFGLTYQISYPSLLYVQQNNILLSPQYILRNFYFHFVRLISIDWTYPFISIDLGGNSIFIIYPFTILLSFNLKNIFNQIKVNALILIIAAVSLAQIIILLFYYNTGYAQFGSRYYLDVFPLLLILLATVINKINRNFIISVIILGVTINYFGAIRFYQLLSF